MAPLSVSELFLQDDEEPDKMPEWLLEEKRDFEGHLDKDDGKILNTDEIRVGGPQRWQVQGRDHTSLQACRSQPGQLC